jgi:exo-beta-1,3-glucanase (GH17 family)
MPLLASSISSTKGVFWTSSSSNIPITTSNTIGAFVLNTGSLCPIINITAANIQIFFDSSVMATNVGIFIL